jgi:DNA-directed RNA polymerase subunit N (RpoN/RPB10)
MASLFPIVCSSCGSEIASKIEEYLKLEKEFGKVTALDKLKIVHPCCREKFLTNVQETNEVVFSYSH